MITIRQAVQAYYYTCLRNRKDINPMRLRGIIRWIRTRVLEGMDLQKIINLK